MAIPDYVRKNFDTLQRAFKNGDVCLVETTKAADNEPAYLVCALQRIGTEEFTFVPMAIMPTTDPYETFNPPMSGSEGVTATKERMDGIAESKVEFTVDKVEVDVEEIRRQADLN